MGTAGPLPYTATRKENMTMSIREWTSRHPQLVSWAVLALGMVIILIIAARDVGLLPGQWAALIVATILLAGLCVWIIGWDGDEEIAEGQETESTAASEPETAPERLSEEEPDAESVEQS
jgi:hypothetical protein